MRPCQLCGCTSWGPVPAPPTLAEVQIGARHAIPAYLEDKDWTQYRVCDGCNAFASLVQMALEGPPALEPAASSFTGALGNLVEAMKTALPTSETRTERLLRSILQGSVAGAVSPSVLVCYVRAIEIEIDGNNADEKDVSAATKGHGGLYNPHGVGGGPWLVLTWKDRRAYTEWAVELVDILVGGSGALCKDWEERAVDYIAGTRPS